MRPGDHKGYCRIVIGKYSGKLVADTPSSYLRWLLDQEWFVTKFTDLRKQIKIELEYRDRFDLHFEEDRG